MPLSTIAIRTKRKVSTTYTMAISRETQGKNDKLVVGAIEKKHIDKGQSILHLENKQ